MQAGQATAVDAAGDASTVIDNLDAARSIWGSVQGRSGREAPALTQDATEVVMVT
jgi:hypothetical protein